MNHLPGFSNLVFCLSVWRLPPHPPPQAPPPLSILSFFLSLCQFANPPLLLPPTLPSIPPTTPPPTRHENGAPLGVPGLSPVWHTLLWSAVSGAKHPTKLPVQGGGGQQMPEEFERKRKDRKADFVSPNSRPRLPSVVYFITSYIFFFYHLVFSTFYFHHFISP